MATTNWEFRVKRPTFEVLIANQTRPPRHLLMQTSHSSDQLSRLQRVEMVSYYSQACPLAQFWNWIYYFPSDHVAMVWFWWAVFTHLQLWQSLEGENLGEEQSHLSRSPPELWQLHDFGRWHDRVSSPFRTSPGWSGSPKCQWASLDLRTLA